MLLTHDEDMDSSCLGLGNKVRPLSCFCSESQWQDDSVTKRTRTSARASGAPHDFIAACQAFLAPCGRHSNAVLWFPLHLGALTY